MQEEDLVLALDASGRRCASVSPFAGAPGAAAAGDGRGSGRPMLVRLPCLGYRCAVHWSRYWISKPRPHSSSPSSAPLHVRRR